MKKYLVCLLLLCFAVPLLAQDNPSRTQTEPVVLTDLAQRMGKDSLTLSDLSGWRWVYGTYSFVVSTGCIGAPSTDPYGGRWQRWEMPYQGKIYVYLISDDAQRLILCNEAALFTPTPVPPLPTATAAETTSPVLTPVAPTSTPSASTGTLGDTTAGATCSLPPRLIVGGMGRVTPGDPNWLHASATRNSEKVGELPGGDTFTVLSGPVCDATSGMNYWQIRVSLGDVWTSEGRDGEYWLEPINSKPLIDPSNATRLKPAGWVTAFPVAIRDIIFSPGSAYFVVVDTTGRAALYNAVTQNLISELRTPGTISQPFAAIEFSQADQYLATADVTNNIYVWDVANVRPLGQITVDKPVTAMAFGTADAAGIVLAVATDDGQVRVWRVPLVTPQTPPLASLTVTGAAASLTFSPDGRSLIARDASGKMLALWEVGS